MIISQLQKDVEAVQACLAKGNLDEAETLLELVLMDIKNAQQSVQRIGGTPLERSRCKSSSILNAVIPVHRQPLTPSVSHLCPYP